MAWLGSAPREISMQYKNVLVCILKKQKSLKVYLVKPCVTKFASVRSIYEVLFNNNKTN